MPYADADGVKIYYEVHGDGPTVLFAHGAGGHHAIWWQQIPHLRTRYRVLAMDFPGFGRSEALADYDTRVFSDYILAVLDDAGADRVALVGQSLGSPPSLRLAVNRPDRVAGVVVSHSIGGISDQDILTRLLADRAEAEKLPVVDRLMSRKEQLTKPEKVFLFQQLGTFNTARQPDLKHAWSGTVSVDEVKEAISAGVYVLFLGGADDAVIRPETYALLQERLPQAHYELIDGAPHSMYWEAPEVFNRVLDRALDSIYPSDQSSAAPA